MSESSLPEKQPVLPDDYEVEQTNLRLMADVEIGASNRVYVSFQTRQGKSNVTPVIFSGELKGLHTDPSDTWWADIELKTISLVGDRNAWKKDIIRVFKGEIDEPGHVSYAPIDQGETRSFRLADIISPVMTSEELS